MKKVLIVEDEVSVLKALSDKLNYEGLTVLEAKNGKEGLDIALHDHPDIILLDIIMPVMDGITMLKKLKMDEWGKTVPIIILTNLNDSENVSEALKNGVYDFLVKTDWTLEHITQLVKERLAIPK